ncbi:MAG: hypothetical protein LBP51_03315 [Deferribacteraceae bacterium]|jgi:hypothetical protein|nr:hypothetical protein [Deferribacteraceae bacterium]
MTNEEIVEKLNSTKSSDRRRAAKEIGKKIIVELGDDLYKKYLEEIKDKKRWETQCEMIKSLGIINYKNAMGNIEKIVTDNISHDAVTICAATTYVQLKRQSLNDGLPVLELLEFGRISVIIGSLMALAYDKMVPDDNTIEKIIKLCWDLHIHNDISVGISGGRKYLAIACANWDKKLTERILNHYIQTAGKDNNLIDVCNNSLKGKYSKSYL